MWNTNKAKIRETETRKPEEESPLIKNKAIAVTGFHSTFKGSQNTKTDFFNKLN